MPAASALPFLLPVLDAWDETLKLRGVRLGAPPELSARYQRPGQYLDVEEEGTRSYFALAAAPGSAALEILVRRGSTVADAVAEMEPGQAYLRVHDVLGEGFPLQEQRGRDLVLVAAGSGIAPLRALLQEVLERRSDFGAVALYYGQQREGEFAYAREFPSWERRDVRVFPVVSEGGGYVQDLLARSPPPFLGAGTTAFLCGMRPMMDAAAAVLSQYGVPEDRLFENR